MVCIPSTILMFDQPIFQYISFLNTGPFSPLHRSEDFEKYLQNIKESWEPLNMYEMSKLKENLDDIQRFIKVDEYKNKIHEVWLLAYQLQSTPMKISFLKL